MQQRQHRLDERVTAQFYDVLTETMRDVSQGQWDRLVARVKQMQAETAALQRVLDEHGIPLPEGVLRRVPLKAHNKEAMT